jgi:hypothetical protein
MTDIPDPNVVVPASLVKSGFPFQTAVADAVAHTPGWGVVAQELPCDELAKDHFLDIVAEGRDSAVILTIEAKKTDKEVLTFLLPEPAKDSESGARILHLRELTRAEETTVARLQIYSAEWQFSPASAQSAFCVVSTSTTGADSRLLERDSQLLIRATDAYAMAEKRRYEFKQMAPRLPRQPIIPMIVTNAQLFVARYEPGEVSLETGRFSETPPHSPVNVIRFRKSFLSHPERDLGERTVFVVNARGLAEVLKTHARLPGRCVSVETLYVT